ncbi:MAG: hypothetical protein A4S09_17155 [Proteobacteria bacterium SG_bin7]|nr:MAG: hypothetical protein A4S09_17155 [Proteobacteria bacterium SG_bin7]
MKNILDLKRIILSIILIVSPNFVLAGGTGPGGANSIEYTFEVAKKYLAETLINIDATQLEKLPPPSKIVLQEKLNQLVIEISGLDLDFDHLNEEPFKHINGSETGIQTAIGVSNSPIKIRSKILASQGSLKVKDAMSYLAHEIAHHLQIENNKSMTTLESEAWILARAWLDLFNSKINFPNLVEMGGFYVAKGALCKDTAEISADPFIGVISIVSNTTDIEACKNDYNNKKFDDSRGAGSMATAIAIKATLKHILYSNVVDFRFVRHNAVATTPYAQSERDNQAYGVVEATPLVGGNLMIKYYHYTDANYRNTGEAFSGRSSYTSHYSLFYNAYNIQYKKIQ